MWYHNISDPEKENRESKSTIPTLFGTTLDKVHLAVLAIVCGLNVSDGFDISQRLKVKDMF